jgi:catechol 2,3-dioxygenase-like lactoylglutathione lyase family enzyme
MSIIPIVRCRNLRRSILFYTEVLDFAHLFGNDNQQDPSFAVVCRAGKYLFPSSHAGDGEFGQRIAILTDDVQKLFDTFKARGLATPGNPESPVREGPVDQSWGTREFYVDDPDGNTLRFIEGCSLPA